MKKFITLLLLVLFVSVNAYSQTAVRKYEYAVVRYDIYGKENITISFENNRVENYNELKNIKIKRSFESDMSNILGALSYMDEQDYELVSTFTETNGGNTVGTQYIFKREIKK